MNHTTAAQLDNETGPAIRQRQEALHGWAAHAVWILLAILVFAPTIYWLCQRWTMSVWHNIHGMFIPFVVAYFIYRVLHSDQIADAEQSAWGFLFLIPGLGMIVLDSAIHTQLLAAFGMVVCLPGLSLLLLGRRRTQALAFAWVLAFFMLPIPAAFIESFTLLLRRISAAGAEPVIALFGGPVARVDTTLFLPADTSVYHGRVQRFFRALCLRHAGAGPGLHEPLMAAGRDHAGGGFPHCDGLQYLALRVPCAHSSALGKRHPA